MTQMDADERDAQTYAIIGAAMEVHRILGDGFLEAVYQAAFATELSARDIPFWREAPLDIVYKGAPLPVTYKVDFLCFESVIVELKALASLSGKDEAQAINYLKASGCQRPCCLILAVRDWNTNGSSFHFIICANLRHLRTKS